MAIQIIESLEEHQATKNIRWFVEYISERELFDFIIKRYPQFRFKKFKEYLFVGIYSDSFKNSSCQFDIHNCWGGKIPEYNYLIPRLKIGGKSVISDSTPIYTIEELDRILSEYMNLYQEYLERGASNE